METRKNLLLVVGEWWEAQRATSPNAARPTNRALTWLGRQLTPNLGSVLLVLILLSTFPGIAAPLGGPSAASVSTMPYQGRLADASGNPITGKHNMEFRLYDSPVSATPLWEEFWTGGNSVDVSDGLFSVMLGSINTNLASVVQANNNLYLGITVGTDSEMTPRVQLGSVPFSIWSLTVADGSVTSDKIAAGAVTQAKLGADVNLEPPDGSITTVKLANEAVTTAKIANSAVGTNAIVDGAVTTAKIANGAVIQAKAPTLIRSNLSNTQIQYGKVWVTASQTTDQLWVDIDFSPNFGSAPAFIIQPAITNHWDIIATYGHCDTAGDKCRAFFTQADGGSWTAGQFVEFSWIAIQQD